MAFDLRDMDDVTPEPMRAEYMPQGDHPMLIRHAEYVSRDDCVFVRLLLEALPPSPVAGRILCWMVFVQDEHTVANAMLCLESMGLADAADWSVASGRPFSKEFPACADRLIGLRFVGHKRLRITPDGRVYHRFSPIRPLTEGEV